MADASITRAGGPAAVPDDEQSEAGDYLIRRLPVWMPIDDSTGNFRLLDVVGRAIDRMDSDIEAVDTATTVQTAETVAQLEHLGSLVNVTPKQDEAVEKYRSRILNQYQLLTSEATPSDLINNVATILGVSPTKIGYQEEDEHGVVTLSLPVTPLSAANISRSEFIDIIAEQIAAGFRLEANIRGTFTYITPAQYTDTSFEHDPMRSYDADADSDGQPDGTYEGTYAGLIE